MKSSGSESSEAGMSDLQPAFRREGIVNLVRERQDLRRGSADGSESGRRILGKRGELAPGNELSGELFAIR